MYVFFSESFGKHLFYHIHHFVTVYKGRIAGDAFKLKSCTVTVADTLSYLSYTSYGQLFGLGIKRSAGSPEKHAVRNLVLYSTSLDHAESNYCRIVGRHIS